MEENIIKSYGITILKGTIISFLVNFLGLIILSVVMINSSISDANIPTIVIGINTGAILIGSSIACMKIGKKGIINGLIIGLVYMLVYLLIALIFSGQMNFSIKTLITILLGIIAGGIGGIIGVNLYRKK